MKYKHDPDGQRLPIKMDSASNGEFSPVPLEKFHYKAIRLAHQWADENARRLNFSRRRFMTSACAAATTLLAFGHAQKAMGRTGGFVDLPDEAVLDHDLAAANISGDEFIFDVQHHHVNPVGKWRNPDSYFKKILKHFPNSQCEHEIPKGEYGYINCFAGENYIKDVFMDSDTDMGVMSFVPSTFENAPLTMEEANATREIVDKMGHRLLLHGKVNPNLPGDMDRMDELKEKWDVRAWKTYTQWGAGKPRTGYFLDDEETGIPFIEKARALGVKIICIHKGIPFGQDSYEHSTCRDIGVVAKRYPDMTFMIYHAGWDKGVREDAYDVHNAYAGVNSLVKSLQDNGVKPNSNVYAETGSTWRFLMRDFTQAAHVWGKLLKYVGEDNVMWGTDSIWYGSPQDQIQAFRSFQIADELQDKHGYPRLTKSLKEKIFGINASRIYNVDIPVTRNLAATDIISSEKETYNELPDPSFVTYGPRTRREFLALRKLHGDQP